MAQRFVRAEPLPAERHPKVDCWRLRRCAGCVATSRWVRRDGALGVAPGGKAVMGPAWPCATSAGSTRSPPFSATLAADSGSFRIATEAQVAQRAQAAATAARRTARWAALHFRDGRVWLSSGGGRRRSFVAGAREARQRTCGAKRMELPRAARERRVSIVICGWAFFDSWAELFLRVGCST